MDNFIDKYNPANVRNLTESDIEAMSSLTIEEINALATSYPNSATHNGYLVLFDKNKELKDQTYQISTWQNLASLFKLNVKNFIPYSFYSLLKRNTIKGNKPLPKIDDINLEDVEGLSFAKPFNPVNKNDLFQFTEKELLDAQKQYDEAVESGAHHMTIRSLEKKLQLARGKFNKLYES